MTIKTSRNSMWRVALLLCVCLSMLAACNTSNQQDSSKVINQFAEIAHGSSSSCLTSQLPGASSGYWPLDSNGFQGVFQFLGQSNTRNASITGIVGANLEWSWAKTEPVEGQYNWAQVDKDINVWASIGKPVILRFATAGQLTWSGSVNGSYTPSWVFDNYGVPRVTETNGTIFPLYWNTKYLQKLSNFVNAVAARYDNNPYVAGVEIGVGQGGETEPDGGASTNPNELQLWQQYGYTNALWFQTIQKIVTIYEAAWKHTPLTLMVTSTFLPARDTVYTRALVEKYTVSQGLWLQINSLDDTMSASILNGMGALTATVEEQKQSALNSGYPALDDIKNAVQLGARYVMVYASDLSNTANADALSYARQQTVPTSMQDCSGNNLTLSVSGRVAPVPGATGQSNSFAQMFDGSTGSASSAHAPLSNPSTWSMEGWLFPTMLPQSGALAVLNGADGSNAGGFGFGIASATGGAGSQLVAYFPGVGWIDSGYTFPATRQWYDVIVTRDGATVRFYVNGQKTNNTSVLAPKAVPGHFSIGSGYDQTAGTATHFFTGAIDEVAVYPSALSLSQVKAYYTKIKP